MAAINEGVMEVDLILQVVVMDGVVYRTRLMVGRIAAAIDGFIYI